MREVRKKGVDRKGKQSSFSSTLFRYFFITLVHQNDAYVSGGVLQPGTWEESECITTCAEDDTCFAVDYVTIDRLCWFHSGNTICDAVQYAEGVKHIQLARCGMYLELQPHRPHYYLNSNIKFINFGL